MADPIQNEKLKGNQYKKKKENQEFVLNLWFI